MEWWAFLFTAPERLPDSSLYERDSGITGKGGEAGAPQKGIDFLKGVCTIEAPMRQIWCIIYYNYKSMMDLVSHSFRHQNFIKVIS